MLQLGNLPEDIRIMCQMIGMDHKRPFYRRGRMCYRPYRNHIDAAAGSRTEQVLEAMVAEGKAMRRKSSFPESRYYLTRTGLEYLGSYLKLQIMEMK